MNLIYIPGRETRGSYRNIKLKVQKAEYLACFSHFSVILNNCPNTDDGTLKKNAVSGHRRFYFSTYALLMTPLKATVA